MVTTAAAVTATAAAMGYDWQYPHTITDQWLRDRHTEYHKLVRYWLGQEAKDIAIEPFALRLLIQELDHYPRSRSLLIGDLGAGLSTVILRMWATHRGGARIATMEHDTGWRNRIGGWLNELGLGGYPHLLLPSDEMRRWAASDSFDLILVDHGPEMHTRRDDLPWLSSRLRSDGCLMLDDLHLNHEVQCRRALGLLGLWRISKHIPPADSDDSKPIAFAYPLWLGDTPDPRTGRLRGRGPHRGPCRGRSGKR